MPSKVNTALRALADYDFSKAEVIVSVGADFLGDWQGGGFDSSYAKGTDSKSRKNVSDIFSLKLI